MLATTFAATILPTLTCLFLTTPAIALASAPLSHRQYQNPDSQLVVTYPACDYYRCIFTWTQGQETYINWENAPTGTVKLQLMNDYSDDNQTLAFEIGTATSPSDPSTCDAGAGYGVKVEGSPCGRFNFIVPSEWKPNHNYSVRAYLEGDESIESYTDFIQIKEASGNFPFSTLPNGPAASSTSSSQASTGATSAPVQTSSTSTTSVSSVSSSPPAASSAASNSTSAASRAIEPRIAAVGVALVAILVALAGGSCLV